MLQTYSHLGNLHRLYMGSALTRATYGNGSAVRETLSKSPTCPPFLFWRMSECDITGSACLTPVPDVGDSVWSQKRVSQGWLFLRQVWGPRRMEF